jgi:hypothetical protein
MENKTMDMSEIMVGSDPNSGDDHWNNKWGAIDVFLTLIMAALLIFITITYRHVVMHDQRSIFLLMIVFLAYQLVSFLVVLIISAIVFLILKIFKKEPAAHKLISFYDWFRHVLEASILIFCLVEAVLLLRGDKLKRFSFHQLYFWLMIVTIAFKFIRLIWAFFSPAADTAGQLVLINGNTYRLKAAGNGQSTAEVIDMMSKFDNNQLVRENETVHVEGLEML